MNFTETNTASLEYARMDWRIFPCGKGTKKPAIGDNLVRATTDETQIRKWFSGDAEIGCVPDNEVIIDIDPLELPDHPHDGFAAFAALVERLGPLPPTVTTISGRGGKHLRFKVPPGTKIGGRIVPGVDLKGMGKGYVMLPPSLHPNGNRYTWAECCSPDEQAVAELPAAWLAEIETRRKTERERVDPAAMLAGIPKGERDGEALRYADSMAARGLPKVEAVVLMERFMAASGCTDEKPLEKIDRAYAWVAAQNADTREDDSPWPVIEYGPGLSLEDRGAIAAEYPSEDAPEDIPNPAEFLRDEPRNLARLRMGMKTFDFMTRGGLPNRIVTTILGPPHVGKTPLGIQMALKASDAGYPTIALFRDEGRWAGCIRIGQQLGLDRDKLEDGDSDEIKRFLEKLGQTNIRVPDADSKAWVLENAIKWLLEQAGNGPSFLLSDSLQSVYSEAGAESRSKREEIEAKLRLMESAAKRGVFAVTTSEMNRAAYQHKNDAENVLGIAGGAESRSIEFVSRLIISLRGDAHGVITATLEKNSPGRGKASFPLLFDHDRSSFTEITEDYAEQIGDKAAADKDSKKTARIREKVRKALRGKELGTREFYKAAGVNKDDLIAVCDEMIEDGLLLTRTEGQSKLWSLPEVNRSQGAS